MAPTLRRLALPALLALVALPFGARRVTAQGEATRPRAPRSVAFVADSVAAQGDTAAALAMLDSAVHANHRDAAAWHRLGLIAWETARSKRSGSFIREAWVIGRLRLADSALRLAKAYAPDSARYQLDLARFFVNSDVPTLRVQVNGVLSGAVKAAERAGDSTLLATTADELGMNDWRRYEAVANRPIQTIGVAFPSDVMLDSLASDMPSRLGDYLEQASHALPPDDWSGQQDYLKAIENFERAVKADPYNMRARRHVYMALAERERWEELRGVARARVREAPWDPNAWLALGLAAHRIGRDAEAAAAFDSGLVNLTAEDRERYTRISRILRTDVPPPPSKEKTKGAAARPRRTISDSAAYEQISAAERATLDGMYWMMADPLTLTPENEHRLEFLSRVAFAELRWTFEEQGLKGADTDRGDIYIRYGPPDTHYGYPSLELWRWRSGLAFVFNAPPTFGTARLAMGSRSRAEYIKREFPVQWENVPIGRQLDTIPALATRFRASADSADVVIVADVPVGRMVDSMDVRAAPVDVALTIYSGPGTITVRDSTRITVPVRDSTDAPTRMRTWRERLPVGTHVYRVEALQPDRRHGGRSAAGLSLVDTAGFGTSDLLLAERLAPKEGSAGARWSDFNMLPSVGRFARGTPIALLWETYGLARDAEGAQRYGVVIAFERTRASKAAAIIAKVVSGVGGATGLTAKENNGRVTLRYERTGPAAAVALDYLTLDVSAAPAGTYALSVEITDRQTKQVRTLRRSVRIE